MEARTERRMYVYWAAVVFAIYQQTRQGHAANAIILLLIGKGPEEEVGAPAAHSCWKEEGQKGS
jgi:hypothetical protein